jgi:hypothetical protein
MVIELFPNLTLSLNPASDNGLLMMAQRCCFALIPIYLSVYLPGQTIITIIYPGKVLCRRYLVFTLRSILGSPACYPGSNDI